ncbi:hypothetical protein C8R42DRAFT_729832 [Lentinula raphanica]|nr:hypothetical protein C8R42DRAFT_729832 [Lentinula raphanica]
MASQSFKKFQPNVATLTMMLLRAQRGEDPQASYASTVLSIVKSYGVRYFLNFWGTVLNVENLQQCPTYVKPLIQAVYEFGAEIIRTNAKMDPEDLSCLQHIEVVMLKPDSDSSPLLVMQAGTYVNHFQSKLREITSEKPPQQSRGLSLPPPHSQRTLVRAEDEANKGPGNTRNNTDSNDNVPKSEITYDNVKDGSCNPLMDSPVSSALVLEGDIPDLQLDPRSRPKSKSLPLRSRTKESIVDSLKVKSKSLDLRLKHHSRTGSTQLRADSDTPQHGQWSLHVTEASGGMRKYLHMLVSRRPTLSRQSWVI